LNSTISNYIGMQFKLDSGYRMDYDI